MHPVLQQLLSNFPLTAAAAAASVFSNKQIGMSCTGALAVSSRPISFLGVLWSSCFLYLPAAVASLIKWKLVAAPELAALTGQSLCAKNNEPNSWDISNEIFF